MTQPSPMMEARAFRIWQYAKPRGWDCSYEEIGAALGLTRNEVKWTFEKKGWGGRIFARVGVGGGARIAQYKKDRVGPKGVFGEKKNCAIDPLTAPLDDLMRAGIFAGADE